MEILNFINLLPINFVCEKVKSEAWKGLLLQKGSIDDIWRGKRPSSTG